MLTRVAAVVAAVGVLAAAGCTAKLDDKRTVSVDAGDVRVLEFPKQSKPQTVTVLFESPNEVDVYVLDAAKAGGFEDLPADKRAAAAIESQTKQKGGTITASIPANTEWRLAVAAPKAKSDVSVHVKNK